MKLRTLMVPIATVAMSVTILPPLAELTRGTALEQFTTGTHLQSFAEFTRGSPLVEFTSPVFHGINILTT